jgi:hypothetical protein
VVNPATFNLPSYYPQVTDLLREISSWHPPDADPTGTARASQPHS